MVGGLTGDETAAMDVENGLAVIRAGHAEALGLHAAEVHDLGVDGRRGGPRIFRHVGHDLAQGHHVGLALEAPFHGEAQQFVDEEQLDGHDRPPGYLRRRTLGHMVSCGEEGDGAPGPMTRPAALPAAFAE